MTYKLLTYQAGGDARAGVLVGDSVYDAAKVSGDSAHSNVLGIHGIEDIGEFTHTVTG